MATKSLLPRGFKTKAEKTALEYRKELSLSPHDPLCGFVLSKHLNIDIFNPLDIFPKGTNIEALEGWSALTMKTKGNKSIIIHNHLHAPARQQSNIMHELAHVICKHESPQLHKEIRLPDFMREYNKQHEEEANYLGSTLQITRDGLVWALKKRMSISEIAKHFNASESMVQLRINTTGVKRQLKLS